MFRVLLLATLCVLAGCVTSYQHISNPRVGDDGVDLFCGGIKQEVAAFELRGDLCKNVSPYGGEFARFAIEYHWDR